MPTGRCYKCRENLLAEAKECLECGAPTLNTLILVPGHAVYTGAEPAHSRETAHWRGTFEGYQDNDEAELYWDHVRTGVILASRGKPPRSLLIFSGGETRSQAGPYSEAQSYWFLAKQNSWFGHQGVEERATTEEFARDSFENLLFSLHRFRQCTGGLPSRIIVCGFSFKSRRYKLHWEKIYEWRNDPRVKLAALEVPEEQFFYVGVNDPPPYILKGPDGSEEGEEATLRDWEGDPFGEGPKLQGKVQKRDPYIHPNDYDLNR